MAANFRRHSASFCGLKTNPGHHRCRAPCRHMTTGGTATALIGPAKIHTNTTPPQNRLERRSLNGFRERAIRCLFRTEGHNSVHELDPMSDPSRARDAPPKRLSENGPAATGTGRPVARSRQSTR